MLRSSNKTVIYWLLKPGYFLIQLDSVRSAHLTLFFTTVHCQSASFAIAAVKQEASLLMCASALLFY